MTATTKFMVKRLRNVGLNRQDSHRLSTWFAFQVKHQGPERAINFLKAVGDCMLNVLLGLSVKTAWVKTSAGGWPMALLFLIQKPEGKGYSKETLLRVSKFARAIRLTEVTKRQVDKVVSAATSPYRGTEDGLELLSQMINLGITTVKIPMGGLLGHPVVSAPRSPKHIARCTTRYLTTQSRGLVETTVDPPVLEALETVMRTPQLYNLPYWKESFHPLSPRYLNEVFETWTGTETDTNVGAIHATQEGAGKLRMYAAPLSIVQCLLYPIHKWIDRIRKTLVSDCTYNQLSGALWAQEELRQGKTVYSVDLTTATCRFPLKPQLDMLKVMGLDTVFLDALEWACTGIWDVGEELLPMFPPTMSWNTGQPLGIAPSMSMFSTAHNLLLFGISRAIGAPLGCFRVLGDDVVITDYGVYCEYLRIMSMCDVPISTNKSHISDQFAEFAGYMITPDLLIRAGQWRAAEMKNHLALSRELRTPLYGEVSKEMIEAEMLDLFSLGIYDPPKMNWSKFLRANTALKYREIPYTDGSLYSRKVREYYRSLFNTSINGVYPDFIADEIDEIDFIWKPIEDLILSDPVRYSWLSSHKIGLGMHAKNSIFGAAWTLLMVLASQLTVHGREHVFQLVYSSVRGRVMSIIWKSQEANPFDNADYQHTKALVAALKAAT